jgi:hypothetical protein
MIDNDLISYEELFHAVENDATDNHFKTAAQFLLEALNDWPTPNLNEPQGLIAELKNEIKDKLTFDNIVRYSRTLRAEIDPWKMEAVSSLHEMFDFNRTNNVDRKIELEEIVIRLTQHYRQKNAENH